MKRKSITLLGLLCLMLFAAFQNCGKPTELDYSSSMDTSTEQGLQASSIEILSKNCSECHTQSTPNGNVGDITDPNYLLYTRLIVPGEPELSPIITEVTSGDMPQGKSPLSSEQIEILKSWIAGLTPDSGTGGAPVEAVIDPKYSVLAVKVFGPACVSCHANRAYKFDSYQNVMASVSQNKLIPAITTGVPNVGRMPLNGALSAAQIKAVQDWVAMGAPNN